MINNSCGFARRFLKDAVRETASDWQVGFLAVMRLNSIAIRPDA